MTDSPMNPGTITTNRRLSANQFCGLGVALGVLAGLPYLLWLSLYILVSFNIDILPSLHSYIAVIAAISGLFCGILFGIPAIILAIRGWIKLSDKRKYF